MNGNLKVLRRKGKTRGTKEARGKYSKGKSIRKRDKTVYNRAEAGDWEVDSVVSGLGKSKVCFATLTERKTRYYIAVKMPDSKAKTLERTIEAVLSAFPSKLVKTITCDRGTGFANWRSMEQTLGCDVYFTDPCCAWHWNRAAGTSASRPTSASKARMAPLPANSWRWDLAWPPCWQK